MRFYPAVRFSRLLNYSSLQLNRCFCDNVLESSKKYLLIEKHGNITTIGINRPSKRNCLNADTINQLNQAFDEFACDDSAQAAVLHGEGGNFCSGFDLDEIIEHGYEPILDAISRFRMQPFCQKPVVGAISGYAVAEGFELALSCDLRVIEEISVLGFAGRRFGAPMILGGSKLFSNLVGGSRALDMVMTGRLINGLTANDWGIASRIVATGTGLGQAMSLAMCVAKFPESGLQHDKMNIWHSYQQELSQHRKEEIDRLRKLASEDVKRLALQFKAGIGRHAKFHSLTTRKDLEWEKDDKTDIDKAIEKRKFLKEKKMKRLNNLEEEELK